MIVWGGYNSTDGYVGSGARYDPYANRWTTMSNRGSPSRRRGHSAIWTGTEMIVWGGEVSGTDDTNTGGRYDPATDTWRPLPVVGAPAARSRHTATWTGEVMVVIGGATRRDATAGCAAYDPERDEWSAPSSSLLCYGYGHTATWTGTWIYLFRNVGVRFDPRRETWEYLPTLGAPEMRFDHTAIWTGSQLVVWGGYYPPLDSARFDEARGEWLAVSSSGQPSGRYGHTAVWTGREMVIWGGGLSTPYANDGGRYDPVTDTWRALEPAPLSGRTRHTAVWTGLEMIVWGGGTVSDHVATGAHWVPGP